MISPSRVLSEIREPRPLVTWRNLKSMTSTMKINSRKIVSYTVTLPSTWLQMQVRAVNVAWHRHVWFPKSLSLVWEKLTLCWEGGWHKGQRTLWRKPSALQRVHAERVVTFF